MFLIVYNDILLMLSEEKWEKRAQKGPNLRFFAKNCVFSLWQIQNRSLDGPNWHLITPQYWANTNYKVLTSLATFPDTFRPSKEVTYVFIPPFSYINLKNVKKYPLFEARKKKKAIDRWICFWPKRKLEVSYCLKNTKSKMVYFFHFLVPFPHGVLHYKRYVFVKWTHLLNNTRHLNTCHY